MSTLTVGMLVLVGPRYVMADHPPFIGNGRHEPDEWTGLRLRVMGLRGPDAQLAPGDILEPTVEDELVTIHTRRLTPC